MTQWKSSQFFSCVLLELKEARLALTECQKPEVCRLSSLAVCTRCVSCGLVQHSEKSDLPKRPSVKQQTSLDEAQGNTGQKEDDVGIMKDESGRQD